MKNINEFLSKNEKAIYDLRALYEHYGYSKYKMQKFEEYDLYAENKSFLKSENVITFTDLSGKLMALKPDVTLSIAKNALWEKNGFQKVYYTENVYRGDKSAGEYKEIMQLGLEYIGDIDLFVLSEVLTLAAKSLESISCEYVMDVSHMGFVAGLLESIDVREKVKDALLSAISKKDYGSIISLCENEGVSHEKAKKIASLTRIYGSFDDCKEKIFALVENDKMKLAYYELCEIFSSLSKFTWGDKIKIDFSLINDMNYYNGITFSGFVPGVPCSILSGGRYDNLIEKLGKRSSAIGFAVYIDLLEIYDRTETVSDVDCLLLYNDGDDAALVLAECEKIIEKGYTVRVLKSADKGTRYKHIIQYKEGVSNTLEEGR